MACLLCPFTLQVILANYFRLITLYFTTDLNLMHYIHPTTISDRIAAAVEYAIDGISINAIAPGAILTPMVAEAFRQINPEDPKKAEFEFAQGNPTKRFFLSQIFNC